MIPAPGMTRCHGWPPSWPVAHAGLPTFKRKPRRPDIARQDEAGEAEGLVTQGISRQGRWLIEAGLFDFAQGDAERWRAYRLVDPEGMGEELSVLVQSKGIEQRATNPG